VERYLGITLQQAACVRALDSIFAVSNRQQVLPQQAADVTEGLRKAMHLERSNGRDFVTDLSEEIVAKRLVDLYYALMPCHAQVSLSKLRTYVNRRGT